MLRSQATNSFFDHWIHSPVDFTLQETVEKLGCYILGKNSPNIFFQMLDVNSLRKFIMFSMPGKLTFKTPFSQCSGNPENYELREIPVQLQYYHKETPFPIVATQNKLEKMAIQSACWISCFWPFIVPDFWISHGIDKTIHKRRNPNAANHVHDGWPLSDSMTASHRLGPRFTFTLILRLNSHFTLRSTTDGLNISQF